MASLLERGLLTELIACPTNLCDAHRLPDVAVSSTLPRSTYGDSVSFTATVGGTGTTPTGTVQFIVDGQTFGSAVTLAGGTATSSSTTLLGAGKHTIQAQYSGDANYAANTGSYAQVVNQAHLSIVPDNLSRPVGQANPAADLHVQWLRQRRHGGDVKDHRISRPGDDGDAEQPGRQLPDHGDRRGHACRRPNYDFPSADFGTGTLTVTPGAASVVVGSTLPASTYGQSVSFTVTVSGGGPAPTGTVQFVVDGTNLGSAVTLVERKRHEPQHNPAGRGEATPSRPSTRATPTTRRTRAATPRSSTRHP